MIRFLFSILVSLTFSGCALAELEAENGETQNLESPSPEQGQAPNQFGWDDSNCAHVMADGHCAHRTGVSALDPDVPNANGWNSSNCAHIEADGSCAHQL